MNPIVGVRFKLVGKNYDVCEDEFNKLSSEEQSKYTSIAYPGAECVPVETDKIVTKPIATATVELLEHSTASITTCGDSGNQITDIAVSDRGTVAVLSDGSVYYWGFRRTERGSIDNIPNAFSDYQNAVQAAAKICGCSVEDVCRVSKSKDTQQFDVATQTN